MQVEEFANQWRSTAGTSVGIYPSTAHYGARVKLRLRYHSHNEHIAAAFDRLVQELEKQLG